LRVRSVGDPTTAANWEPPRRLVLAWPITSDFQFDPNPGRPRASPFSTGLADEQPRCGRIFDSGGEPGALQGWAGILRQIRRSRHGPHVIASLSA
jgi:hypothetical protein